MEQGEGKGREAMQNSLYERLVSYYRDWSERQKNGRLVIHFSDVDYQASRQGFLKFYLSPLIHDTALNTWAVFEHLVKRQTGRHNHQGGIVIYVIEGEGTTEVDGLFLDWKAGDLLLLPIQPGGCTHQHWNRDETRGCRWIAFRDMLIAPYIANAIDQVGETPDNNGAAVTQNDGNRRQDDWRSVVDDGQIPLLADPRGLASVNLFDRLIQMRDLQVNRQDRATWMIRGEDLSWELNRHGRMQWYLHPCIAYSAVQTNIFYRQEIAPGSRSGLQRHSGDVVFYILQGEGYTEVNGRRYDWKKNDVMTLPLLPQGVVFRHVNTGAEPVQFIGIERNLVHTVGVARHAGFEELEPCPEYP